MSNKPQLADLLRTAPPECWLVVDPDRMTIIATCKQFSEACAAGQNSAIREPLILWSPPKSNQATG